MKLEPSRIKFKRVRDRRPTMPEPPPVQLVAVEDVHIDAPAGLEVQLDEFYAQLLHFEREESVKDHLQYKAENFRLCVDVVEPPIRREDARAVGINVPLLSLLEKQLIDREIEYQWQRGIAAGQTTILLQDPAGNWIQIGEMKVVGW